MAQPTEERKEASLEDWGTYWMETGTKSNSSHSKKEKRP
jgi:hypothetical protein